MGYTDLTHSTAWVSVLWVACQDPGVRASGTVHFNWGNTLAELEASGNNQLGPDAQGMVRMVV
jgi:hypothetical protein